MKKKREVNARAFALYRCKQIEKLVQELKATLSVREVWGSILGPVK